MPPRNTQTEKAVNAGNLSGLMPLAHVWSLFAAFFTSGCTKPIDINVSANEPIKVDLSMDVHVYQHADGDPAEKEAQQNFKEVMTQKRNRSGEIRTLKNSRLIGESVEGLLSIRNLPAGQYGTYVKATVDAENKDRNFLIIYDAEKKSQPVPEVRRDQWRHAQRKAFPGEWIQVEDEANSGSFKWIQKKGAAEE
ncbi:MAG: DUF1318 domain-containing protein [Verrucomicrobiales bacterium]